MWRDVAIMVIRQEFPTPSSSLFNPWCTKPKQLWTTKVLWTFHFVNHQNWVTRPLVPDPQLENHYFRGWHRQTWICIFLSPLITCLTTRFHFPQFLQCKRMIKTALASKANVMEDLEQGFPCINSWVLDVDFGMFFFLCKQLVNFEFAFTWKDIFGYNLW